MNERKGFWAFAYDYKEIFLVLGIIPWATILGVLRRHFGIEDSISFQIATIILFFLQLASFLITVFAFYKENYT